MVFWEGQILFKNIICGVIIEAKALLAVYVWVYGFPFLLKK